MVIWLKRVLFSCHILACLLTSSTTVLVYQNGADSEGDFWPDFDHRVLLDFHGSKICSDGGFLVFRELNETLGLHDLAGRFLPVLGKSGFHTLIGLLRQYTFRHLAGYPDVNYAERLVRDCVMRSIVGGLAVECQAASTSQTARIEAGILASADNPAALANLLGQ